MHACIVSRISPPDELKNAGRQFASRNILRIFVLCFISSLCVFRVRDYISITLFFRTVRVHLYIGRMREHFNRTHLENTRSCRYVIIARETIVCPHAYSSKRRRKQFHVILLRYMNYNFIQSHFSWSIYYRSLHLQFCNENYTHKTI